MPCFYSIGKDSTTMIHLARKAFFGKFTKVKSVEKWQKPDLFTAGAGESIGITTDDELFVERGEVISRRDNAPIRTREIKASIF